MVLPFISRLVACAILSTALVAPAQAQAVSDREGYDSLLSCAAFFSAVAAVTEDDRKTSNDATELATAFMTGAIVLAPGGNSGRAEAELEKQAQDFAVVMLDDSASNAKDMEDLAESCGTLGEVYLPEVLARAG